MLRPGCALPFTSGPQTRSSIFQSATKLYRNFKPLVSAVFVADFVSVNRCSSATCDSSDYRALLATDQATEKCTTNCAPRSGDLVAVLIPNRTVVSVTIVVVAIHVIVVRVVVKSAVLVAGGVAGGGGRGSFLLKEGPVGCFEGCLGARRQPRRARKRKGKKRNKSY